MATATTPAAKAPAPPSTAPRRLGPEDHGRAMTLDDFEAAESRDGWLYELARGVVIVTEVPGIHHGQIVMRINERFVLYQVAHPGLIQYRAGGGECRIRLPGMQSDRHPDQAVYLDPPPTGPNPWRRWCPHLVVEVVSPGSDDRDYVEKREEYLRAGVREYWIVDPKRRRMLVLRRQNDVWEEILVAADAVYASAVLPGLEVRPADLIGPEGEANVEANEM